MKGMRCWLVALLGLLLTGLALAARSGHRDRGPVYSVAQVEAMLARRPEDWLGRPVLVRGLAREVVGYRVLPGCRRPWTCTTIQRTWGLTDPGIPDPARGLPLAWGSPDQRAGCTETPRRGWGEGSWSVAGSRAAPTDCPAPALVGSRCCTTSRRGPPRQGRACRLCPSRRSRMR
jgi:hypothetical protein